MQEFIQQFGRFAPLLIILVAFLVGLFVKAFLVRILVRLAAKTKWKWDDLVIAAIRVWLPIWCVVAGVYIALKVWGIPDKYTGLIDKSFFALLAISITIVLTNLMGKILTTYSQKIETVLPLTSLTQNITKLLILAIGFLIVLNGLGVSITPILTTLGIAGLAVALALQDTLANLFAGFYVAMARQIKIGNYIELETGQKGYVEDIGWRTTKIRMLPNNTVLIPNSKLAQAIITNYYLPVMELAVLVQVGVHYDSDLEKVEKITIEVAEEVMKEVRGGVPSFKPFIRYHTFNDFSIDFTVILRAKEAVATYSVKHEFIKRLHRRYNKEKIIIPFPIRTVQMEK